MTPDKFHCSLEYKVTSATKLHKAIVFRVKVDLGPHLHNNLSDLINTPESLIVFRDRNPRLYRMLNTGIRRNVMPLLNGITVVLNSTSCYYTHE
jgi:hypothetical protein